MTTTIKLRSVTALALTGALLAGCGTTMAQRQAETMGSGLRSAVADLKVCNAATRARPEFAPLLPHSIEGRPTPAQLADETYPTADEARLLARLTSDPNNCWNIFRARSAELMPAAGPALDQIKADRDGVFAELIERKITWGESARQFNQIKAQDMPALRTAAAMTLADLDARHQQELAERQHTAAAVGQIVGGVAVVAGAAAAGYVAAHTPPAVVYVRPAVSTPLYCQAVAPGQAVCQ